MVRLVGEDIHQSFLFVYYLYAACDANALPENLIFLGDRARLLALLRQQDRVDVRQDAARRDRDRAQQLGQLFVVSDGQLDVSRYDSGLFVVSGGVPGEFENFSR
jgi:hypothetical protein